MAKKRQRSFLIPLLMMGGGILLIAIVLIWQITASSPSTATAPTVPQGDQSQLPFPEITRISLKDAKAAFDTGSALFLDVRDSASFNAGHIPDAINIELAVLPSQISELDSSRPIITYCT